MRTISGDTPKPTVSATPDRPTFTTTLTTGREVTVREMTGRDLVQMEKDFSKVGDTERAMRLVERLVVGDDKITYDEILDLGIRDFKRLSELVAKASETDEDEDPN